jgi:hypothetical protein
MMIDTEHSPLWAADVIFETVAESRLGFQLKPSRLRARWNSAGLQYGARFGCTTRQPEPQSGAANLPILPG